MQTSMRTVDLRQIEIFYYVAKYLSFSKAAEALLLTQPTISGHIKALEESLDLTLFDRLGREVCLTRAGDVLYGYAKRLLTTKASALQALQELHGGLRGELVIGGSSIPGQYVLPRILGKFQPQYPGITVVLNITDTMETLERIVRGDLELGIVGAVVPHAHIDYHPFMEDELVLAVAADHPWAMQLAVPLAALPEQVFIQRERGSGSRLVVEQTLASAGLDPSHLHVVAEMATTEAIKQGIKAGLGISIISRLALEDEVRAGSICTVAVADVTIQRPFSIIRHTGRSLSPLAQTFERFVRGFSPLDLSGRETLRHGG
jgi:DNA-binding transcriptional LysR family regulator